MDPVSLALSVATALDTVVKVVEYLHDTKEGGKQRIRLIAEISSLWLVLEAIKVQLDEMSAASTSLIPDTYLKTLGLPNGPLQQCQDILNSLHDKSKPRSGSQKVLQSLKWAFDKEEVDRYLLSVHRLQSSINLAYAQTSLTILSNVAADTSATRKEIEGQMLKQLLDWLSPIDFEAQQRQTLREWCPGTVLWTLEVDIYSRFRSRQNPYCWCPSVAGNGKTVLSSLVLRDLKALASENKGTAVLGIYLNSRSASQDESFLSDVLGNLLKQLCSAGLGPDQELRSAFHSATKSNSPLSIEDATSHLTRLLKPLDQAFIVVDAIDELQPHKRRMNMIEKLKQLTPSLSIFMTGRPFEELSKLCAPLSNVCDSCESGREAGFYHCSEHLYGGWDVCASCFSKGTVRCPVETHPSPMYLESTSTLPFEPLNEDIELYCRYRIDNDEHLEKILGRRDSLKQQVIDKIVSESQKRFLTAKLYLNHLATFERARDVKNALQTPLGNLEQTYTQALQSLCSQSPDRVRIAQEVLRWVSYAKDELYAPQLEQAVQFGIEGDDFEEDDIVPIHRLLKFTSVFLTQTYTGSIEFVHFTADEFVSKAVQDWFPDGDSQTTVSCLKFLSRSEFEMDWSSEALVLQLQRRFPFHSYAARNWPRHFSGALQETGCDLAFNFLKNTALVSTASLSLITSDDETKRGEEILKPRLQEIFQPHLSALHMAALSGSESLVQRLMEHHVYTDINAQDSIGRTPLWIAVNKGQRKSVTMLLDAGASPDIADRTGWTPLLIAIVRSLHEISQTLVTHPSRPANINMIGAGKGASTRHVSPLIAATKHGNINAMRMILEQPDVQVNALVSGLTALACCVIEGNLDSAKLLLTHPECDINQVVNGVTALHLARYVCHAEMVEFLISRGANALGIEDTSGTEIEHRDIKGVSEIDVADLQIGEREREGRDTGDQKVFSVQKALEG